MAMTNEQLTKWIDEIFGTIDEIKQNSGDISGLTRSVRQLREDLTATQEDVTDLEYQTAGTVSLAKAQLQHFTDGSATQALDLIADIIPVQAGTGDPSPTNVRAITGYSSVTATAAGKNMWSGSKTDGYYIDNNGNKVSDVASSYSNMIAVNPGDHVTMSGICKTGNAGTKRLHAYDINGNWLAMIASVKPLEDNSPFSCSGIAPENTAYVVMSWYGVASHADHDNNIMLELGTEATPYEAYQANTATLSLGRTIYGGSANFTTGAEQETMASAALDSPSRSWNYRSEIGTGIFSGSLSDYKLATDVVLLCSCYKFIGVVSGVRAMLEADDKTIAVYYDPAFPYDHSLYIKDTDITSTEALITAMDDQIVVYELATPNTYTTTPAQLQLLQGENNVSATSGPITLTYAPDNVLAEVYAYIQKRFDTLTASLAANRTTRKTTKTLTKKED